MKYVVVADDFSGFLLTQNVDGSVSLSPVSTTDTAPTQGIRGPQGEPGAIGPAGIPEAAWQLEGHGPPSDTEPITPGFDGEKYLDLDTGDLYERTDGLWL